MTTPMREGEPTYGTTALAAAGKDSGPTCSRCGGSGTDPDTDSSGPPHCVRCKGTGKDSGEGQTIGRGGAGRENDRPTAADVGESARSGRPSREPRPREAGMAERWWSDARLERVDPMPAPSTPAQHDPHADPVCSACGHVSSDHRPGLCGASFVEDDNSTRCRCLGFKAEGEPPNHPGIPESSNPSKSSNGSTNPSATVPRGEMEELLRRIVKYAIEDRAYTPGSTRLSRAINEARKLLDKDEGDGK